MDIAQQRLLNQRIVRTEFNKPEEVVAWLGAVQSQDYAGAKWALGLRLQGATDNTVEQAFTEGAILRTHLLRPTWHFVTAADIRWMLALTAPHVHALNAYYYRKVELDSTVRSRAYAALEQGLQGGNQLTRDELRGVLQQAGIATDDNLRMGLIMMAAELDGIVCSGARRGKQFTYALLEERVPQARKLEREEALAELARCYFLSHGPATVQDFVWWSGLSMADARKGLASIQSQLTQEAIDGKAYWFSSPRLSEKDRSPAAYLLPNYDEYISYKDRNAIFDRSHLDKLIFAHMLVIDGRISGTWQRSVKKQTIVIASNVFTPLTQAEDQAAAKAARQYGAFLEMPVAQA